MSDTWLSWDELAQRLDADTLRRLRPHLTHTGDGGQLIVEADRLDELLELVELERSACDGGRQ